MQSLTSKNYCRQRGDPTHHGATRPKREILLKIYTRRQGHPPTGKAEATAIERPSISTLFRCMSKTKYFYTRTVTYNLAGEVQVQTVRKHQDLRSRPPKQGSSRLNTTLDAHNPGPTTLTLQQTHIEHKTHTLVITLSESIERATIRRGQLGMADSRTAPRPPRHMARMGLAAAASFALCSSTRHTGPTRTPTSRENTKGVIALDATQTRNRVKSEP